MKIHVRSRKAEVDETVRAQIERRLQFSLGKFSPSILRVAVQIVDLNGPRGGEDKSCRIELRLLPTGSIFVADTDADLYAAVDRAADRAAQCVSRATRRTRQIQRNPTTPRHPLVAAMPSGTEEQRAAQG
jgi:ribosome-associated translation inhibitor RaiA